MHPVVYLIQFKAGFANFDFNLTFAIPLPFFRKRSPASQLHTIRPPCTATILSPVSVAYILLPLDMIEIHSALPG
jgi:hypothetical protein